MGLLLKNARITGRQGLYDIDCGTYIQSIEKSKVTVVSDLVTEYERPVKVNENETSVDCNGNVVLPSLCHSHLHLDKCFLDMSSLQDGSFQEALSSTTEAKKKFHPADLLARGSRLIEQSIAHGVTAMRAHVEVDTVVKHICLEAALRLKERYQDRCDIQVAVFAQDPIFPDNDPTGGLMKGLLSVAADYPGIDAIGSAPYVDNEDTAFENAKFIVGLAAKQDVFLDFHLDYDLNLEREPMIFRLLEYLRRTWKSTKTITLGHVTKLTLLRQEELNTVRELIGAISAPVHLIGLPTSDVGPCQCVSIS